MGLAPELVQAGVTGFIIAGVGIRLNSPVFLDPNGPESHRSFTASTEQLASASSSIEVELVLGRPAPNESPVVFRGNDFWTLQNEAAGYRITLPGGSNTGACVMRSNADTSRVQMYLLCQAVETAGRALLRNPFQHPFDQIMCMNHLVTRGGVIVHSAGIVVNGKTLVFPGVSTAGKSTLTELFMDAGFGSEVLSDDRVIIRQQMERSQPTSGFVAWGTPWFGDARIGRNEGAPLAALLFLHKGEANEVIPIPTGQAMRELMPVVSVPWYDRERGNAVLETCARLVESVPCYDLQFRPEADVIDLLTARTW